MIETQRNIVLIGMAGSGKSSIGGQLALILSRPFIDTDDLIEAAASCTLQNIIATKGLRYFRTLEENVLLGLTLSNHVIATGGSSVYSRNGILHLKKNSIIIYLDVELELLVARINNFDSRGLVKLPEQSFSDLYEERVPLYRQYADYVFPCRNMGEEQVCRELLRYLTDLPG